jgi:hypothetical protein
MAIKLDPDKDLETDVNELQREFKRMAPLMNGWSEVRANAEEAVEIAEAELKELRSEKYIEIKSKEAKVTEAHVSAQLDVDPDIKKAVRNVITLRKDYETIKGFVESLRFKKDMLVQLGADARKE